MSISVGCYLAAELILRIVDKSVFHPVLTHYAYAVSAASPYSVAHGVFYHLVYDVGVILINNIIMYAYIICIIRVVDESYSVSPRSHP